MVVTNGVAIICDGRNKDELTRFILPFSLVFIPDFQAFMPEISGRYLYENNSAVERNWLRVVAEIISLDGTAVLDESR